VNEGAETLQTLVTRQAWRPTWVPHLIHSFPFQDLKCLVFSLMSSHFKISPIQR
jgi:hypothetical protein